MQAGTNAWQRVDDTGCFWVVLRWLLLAWVIVIPYTAMVRSYGWMMFACVCVAVGGWMGFRQRRRGWTPVAGLAVELSSNELHAGDAFAVALRTSGEMARSVRWWRAEMMAGVAADDPKSVAFGEFVVDPEAAVAPVAELHMLLTVPGESELREVKAREWWVQVTVETARGRLESGKVGVRIRF